ncbi:prepilin peptidase [Vibrio hannami]|nr:prepilin peptidase [Vibrio hannami]MDG3085995.1 prepilin peptidase [Vibrio hannami]
MDGYYLLYGIFILVITICIIDFRIRTIPNKLLALVALLVVSHCFLYGQVSNLIFFIPSIIVGGIVWYIGLWGAGDAKLMAILAPLIDLDYYLTTVILILMAGGIQAIISLVALKLSDTKQPAGIAYGVSIAFGCFLGILMTIAEV